MKVILYLSLLTNCLAFTTLSRVVPHQQTSTTTTLFQTSSNDLPSDVTTTRRTLLQNTLTTTATAAAAAAVAFLPNQAEAAVGTLPEYATSNAILQGITVDVADKSQQDEMIAFLSNSFDFKILRRRVTGSVTDTWMGFGPEQLSIPSDFEIPVSSFAKYGGHASIHIRYDSKSLSPLYKRGEDAPGDNIAYLQVGVPTYRISAMVKNGGNVLDAYGIVNVVSPSGLPMRGIVGIMPDPIMFVAINCKNVKESKAFYEQLGFMEQEYPYARPSKGTGQFEPPQPPKSIYMAPSPSCMGVLLLPSTKKRISQNPVVKSLNLVYTPSESQSGGSGGSGEGDIMTLKDPSGVVTGFIPVDMFEQVEKTTLVPQQDS
uniref:VOC domain-containing protein n=1 Tax=Ditylum brightwellii TaxID=49249 RepID=A0A7S4REZ5_9STRA|mmetsp:Transcript_24189/g.32224  ORF Transcript_24189/g.32224 Transcript_24189/m.32224 type:complete len:373 (-) Transcript_24189:389-1507(-)